jgi:CBS domain-containing protein
VSAPAISPDDPIALAQTRMRTRKLRHAVVVDRGTIVGLVDARDLRPGRGRRVAEVMTRRRGPRLIRTRMPRR